MMPVQMSAPPAAVAEPVVGRAAATSTSAARCSASGGAHAQRDVSLVAPETRCCPETLAPETRCCPCDWSGSGIACARTLQPAGDFFVDDERLMHAEPILGPAGALYGASAAGRRLGEWPDATSREAPGRTTLMIQRLTPRQTEENVRSVLVGAGLGDAYDVIYVPMNRKMTANLGYAFVNFVTEEGARACMSNLAGRALGSLTGRRACRVAYSKMQGADFLRQVMESRARGAEQAAASAASSEGDGGSHSWRGSAEEQPSAGVVPALQCVVPPSLPIGLSPPGTSAPYVADDVMWNLPISL